MDISELYEKIEVIKQTPTKQIYLVRSQIDHLLYLQREISLDNKQIYYQLFKSKINQIPKIYHLQEINQKLIVIEQYINAPTLEEYVYNHELSKDEALTIFKQILKIVDSLHHLDPPVIHRDIKPGNIFYEHGKIYLFDFDIARNFQAGKNQDTQFLGSVGYAAPEQYGFGQSSQRSDIYALGNLLNFLLTKQLPGNKLYSGKEKKVILKATHIDETKRYASISLLANDLNLNEEIVSLTSLLNDLPGMHTNSLVKKGLALFGYGLLFLICMISEYTVDGKVMTGLSLWLNRIFSFAVVMTIILMTRNYLGVHHHCFFASSKSRALKIIGIVTTITGAVFLELLLLTFITMIFNLD